MKRCNAPEARRERWLYYPFNQATVVPVGMARLMELQEQGWSYVRPSSC